MGIRTINNIKIKKTSHKEIDISVKEKERRESTPLLDLNLDNIKKQYSNSLKKNDINAPRGPKDTLENRKRTIRIIKKILDGLEYNLEQGLEYNLEQISGQGWKYYKYTKGEKERISRSNLFTVLGEVGQYQIDIAESNDEKHISYDIELSRYVTKDHSTVANIYLVTSLNGIIEQYDYQFKTDNHGRLFNAVYRELRRITNL